MTETGQRANKLSAAFSSTESQIVRRSIRRKLNDLHTRPRLKAEHRRAVVVRRRFNAKAFANLAFTLLVFSFLIIPIMVLQIVLAMRDPSSPIFDNLPPETLVCVSLSFLYSAFPIMTVIADKEVKGTIARMLKRACDKRDFVDPIEYSFNSTTDAKF